MSELPSKVCATCGRAFAWRRRWKNCWDEVRYCSDRCRRQRSNPNHAALEEVILELLADRRRGATICPSEAARRFAPDEWRDWMEPVRQVARGLVARGLVEILQRGQVVDPSTARGPIRLRRRD